jgi:hypothetical protein
MIALAQNQLCTAKGEHTAARFDDDLMTTLTQGLN